MPVSRLSSEFRRSGFAALMLLEERIKKLVTPPEIRSPQPRERVSKVDHAAAGSEVENTERPGDL
jgi:hypothetical protein